MHRLLILFAILIPTSSTIELHADESLLRDKVAPILQKQCLSCHNNKDRKGGLSLQTMRATFVGGDSGRVIEPGKPDSSLLIDYITPAGGNAEMPKNADPLKTDEIAVIRKWISNGAKWPNDFNIEEPRVTDTNWWSLKPLKRPPLPEFADADAEWIRTPIDAFILATLRKKHLFPSPAADRRTLIRRVYFDLIGLPPAPEQIDAFIGDSSATAYEKLIDRLLSSPQYGERWARHWLDVVKYADTCGYDKDKLRPNAWPYRDYVIRSFNADKPYARFVQEQIAGDVLYPGEPDGILGLGFIAAGPWDFIGHAEVPETKIDGRIARHIDRDEMVTNTLNTFSSVTIQCCRCHNHKFDPFTQEHYYGLQAVFAAVDRAERPYDLDPSIEAKRREVQTAFAKLNREQQTIEAAIKKEGGQQLANLENQIASLAPKAHPAQKHPAFGYHSAIESDSRKPKWVQVDLGRPIEIRQIILRPCHDEFAGIGAGFGFPVRFKIEASNDATFKTGVQTIADFTKFDVSNPGLASHQTESKDANARFVRVTATQLVERKNDYIFALAELQILESAGKNVSLRAKVTSLDSIEAPVRWARKNLTDGIWVKAADEKAAAALALAKRKRQTLLSKLNTAQRKQKRDELARAIKSANNQLAALPTGKMVYAAATAFKGRGTFKPTMGKPRLIRVLHRGNILQPGKTSRPGVIPIIASRPIELDLPDGHSEGERRAALARWLTRRDHPLVWRSIVNRLWQYHFGRGIVDSPNDFGRMGQLPTHPELLDWLAIHFRDNGQSIKKLHRLICTSSVYRQSSAYDSTRQKIDANNQFLWRMNRRRLEAEEVRDAILAVSGRMNHGMFGPGFYLFQLEKTDHSPHYEYHKHDPEDAKSHRRSVYRFIVRSQPDPFMTTLDCADSSQSTPQRNETLTSLQALSLLNNKFTLAMSRHFARRLESEERTLPARIDRAMRLVVGRAATDDERGQLLGYATKHGLANLCRVLLNMSEFVYLD